MVDQRDDAPHPGQRIRSGVFPANMSVKRAAELLGVSRPTLSNLLNGNASLSAEMASRLAKTFGTSRSALMQMQAEYDQSLAQKSSVPLKTVAYVPPYLAIKARHISEWASNNLSARSRLAVLLRTLVNSTAVDPELVDFPGNDDSERTGWDGRVTAGGTMPWVPQGQSGWEFGCTKDSKAKADGDYDKSVLAISRQARQSITFVFVTPHAWHGKVLWEASKRKAKEWKHVRAFDASDLEQWIGQSLPGQAWFANETGMPSEEVRSLDTCWKDWANVATPALPPALFQPAIDATKELMLARLTRESPEPTLIAADSVEEGLAFVSQLLGPMGGEQLAMLRDRVLVFDQRGALRKLAESSRPFISVVHSREVEHELGPYAKKFPSILIYPRNAHIDPHVRLEPISHEALQAALAESGKTVDEINGLETASGRSLTVLRRRLAIAPAIRRPEWAEDAATASQLVPCMLIGAWNTANEFDMRALAELAGNRSAEEIERDCQQMARMNDAPVWSEGTYRGVVSKMDALFAVAERVTAECLRRYFSLARRVLGEDDPALDLPDDQRWLASLHGKTRAFSKAFRDGISETLVLLSLHGHLFKRRGIDPEADMCALFDAIFPKPLTTRLLEASSHELPTYAEAVPLRFLEMLEDDLKQTDPVVLGLLKPVDNGVFGASPRRTGLLWALEGLAWNPKYLPRVVTILARLSQVEINDNWTNKPEGSLQAIFRSWMPQTAADLPTRVSLIRRLQTKFPDVAWRVCLAQIGRDQHFASGSQKPRWRTDGYGHGRPVASWEPVTAFEGEMLVLALGWSSFTFDMLSDLVEKLPALSEEFQARIWKLIEAWGRDHAADADRGRLVEKIRVTTHSLQATLRARKRPKHDTLRAPAEAAMAALAPAEALNRHLWLFENAWVQESADELDDLEDIDHQQRDERIKNLRLAALKEIIDDQGNSGLFELVAKGKTSWLMGALAVQLIPSNEELKKVILSGLDRAACREQESLAIKQFVGGAVRATYYEAPRAELISDLVQGMDDAAAVDVLLVAPFQSRTWRLVDRLGEVSRRRYWLEASPEHTQHYDDQTREGANGLIAVGRPRAAFSYIHGHLSSADPQFLASVLSAMGSPGNDAPGEYPLERYHIEKAFKKIGASAALSLDEKAILEYLYVEVLVGHGERNRAYGIPNLERYVEQHPELFVQAIVWRYKRDDRGEDPEGFRVQSSQEGEMAQRAYRLLDALHRLPGHDEHGVLSVNALLRWVADVRVKCTELCRRDHADREIGDLLSNASEGGDGVWPCEVVREVMEQVQSPELMRGAYIGRCNARGAHWRGEGGIQERELADQYRKWASALQSTHPFVASELLLAMAESYERQAEREDVNANVRRRLV